MATSIELDLNLIHSKDLPPRLWLRVEVGDAPSSHHPNIGSRRLDVPWTGYDNSLYSIVILEEILLI